MSSIFKMIKIRLFQGRKLYKRMYVCVMMNMGDENV